MNEEVLFTYDHYEPGKLYGTSEFTVDEETVAKWRSVYPADNDPGLMPAGMTAMISVDAILTHQSPRPPGGVHGGQSFDIHRMPKIGETLITEVRCISKEIRKGRKWAYSETRTTNKETGELLFTGIMTSLVAE